VLIDEYMKMWFLSGRRHAEKAACKQQVEGIEEKMLNTIHCGKSYEK
jgi:hypothetical protein